MNYFERLIRRALLEAPARAGEALRDPFANEAPLPLDDAGSAARARRGPCVQPARPAEIAAAPRTESRTEHSSERETHTTHEPAAAPASSIQPQAPAAPAPRRAVEVHVRRDTHGARASRRFHALAGRDAARHRSACARPVDARVAGAARRAARSAWSGTPDERIAAAAAEPPPCDAADDAAARSHPRPCAAGATCRRKEAARPPVHARPSRTAPPERTALRRTVREMVRETIRVVKVAESQSGHASLAGAAPPTFGAGQL